MKLRSTIFYILLLAVFSLTAGVFLSNLSDPKVIAAGVAWLCLCGFLYWDCGRVFNLSRNDVDPN